MKRKQLHRWACILFVANAALTHTASTVSWMHSRIGSVVIAQYLIASFCMIVAWRTHARADPAAIRWVMVTGVLARLILIPVYPYSSNDIERYLWDGRVALEGLDPYRVVPNAPEVAHLRPIWATPPEHAAIPTLYPPAAIASFSLAALAGPSYAWIAWKSLMAIVSIGIIAVLFPLLRRWQALDHLALASLSPLLVFELGVGAHLDGFATFTMIGSLMAVTKSRPAWAGALLGLGALFKLLPIVAIVPLAVYWGFHRRTALLVASAVATITAGYASAVGIGLEPLGSTVHFLSNWRFGSPAFSMLHALFSTPVANSILAGLVGCGLVAALRFARHRPICSIQVYFGLPLLLSPVLFPWYLCILVPLVAITPSYVILAWMTSLPLTYEVLNDFIGSGEWRPATWPLVVISVSLAAGTLADLAHYDGISRWRVRSISGSPDPDPSSHSATPQRSAR